MGLRPVIEISSLSKVFKIYEAPADRLKETLHPLRKKYHHPFSAVDGLSFSVAAGEVVGIIGRNGSGKSTLLKMITGVLTPTAGALRVDGKVSALLELGAGFNPELTGRDNIYFQGSLMGYSHAEMDAKLIDILDFAEIGEYVDQPVKNYSSGMFARLAFAVVVHVEPDVLIIDEALSVGDIRFQQKAIRKMQALMSQAKAILFVSHDMRSIRTFCSRVIWLADGKIFRDGDPKTVARLYEDYMIHGILPKGETPALRASAEPYDVKRSESTAGEQFTWSPVDPTSELGGEAASFTRIALETSTGTHPQSLAGDETLTVLAELAIRQRIDEPLLGLGIFNDKGLAVVHFNSSSASSDVHALEAGQIVRIRYRVPLPNLRDGNYFLSLGLDEGVPGVNTVIHHVSDCYCLKVHRTDSFSQQYGTIIIPEALIEMV